MFEIIDVIEKADIVILFDGVSYQNTRDGFVVSHTGKAVSVKQIYRNIRKVQNSSRQLIAKRKRPGMPLTNTKKYFYHNRATS